MRRDVQRLTGQPYDVLVIGGGIYGACVAREASLHDLSVALVEKADFGSATSSNSLKIIHGGLRYLQHADFKRMRESIQERTTLMRIAPHLVHPLPILIPTYGHGMQGKEILRLALAVNDLLSSDRNRLEDPQKHIPCGKSISKAEMLQKLPGIDQAGLTGGVQFYDAQVYNSERLILAFLRSAEKFGAELANYVMVTGFLKEKDRIIGVTARDTMTGELLDVRAQMVINMAGPWVDQILSTLHGKPIAPSTRFARAMNLITRQLFKSCAAGVATKSKNRDKDAVIKKGNRLLFITPWRGRSIIGTGYELYVGDVDEVKITAQDIQHFLDEINDAYPAGDLKMEEVYFTHGGLIPCAGMDPHTESLQLTKQYKIHDHQAEGIKGLISVHGVKYTTARHVAEEVVNHVMSARGQAPKKSMSMVTPLEGGEIGGFETFLNTEMQNPPYGLHGDIVRRLIYNYGSEYPAVLEYLCEEVKLGKRVPDDLEVVRAEVRHGMRQEMAQTLSDVIFRRTELGTAGNPGTGSLEACADVMKEEFGWSPFKVQKEIEEVKSRFPVWG